MYLTLSPQDYVIAPVGPERAASLFDFIQIQAEVHRTRIVEADCAAVRDGLFRAIAETGDLGAFLVIDRASGQTVTVVTYYDCYTPFGRGVYLEDIVTRPDWRGRGLGTLAMSALAQIALREGAAAVRWECAAHNLTAQRFYDGLGGMRLDRETWRLMRDAAALPEREERPAPGRAEAFLLRAIREREEASPLTMPFSPDSLPPFDNEGRGGLRVVGLGAEFMPPLSVAYLYRSYSTFRARAGLHVETLYVGQNDPALAALTLAHIEDRIGRVWSGHMDVTVGADQAAWLVPALAERGFAPLSYGEDRMIARILPREALLPLAVVTGRDLVAALPLGGSCSRSILSIRSVQPVAEGVHL